MPMLNTRDRLDLIDVAITAQPVHSLVLGRYDSGGNLTTLPPQEVQVAYAGRQPMQDAIPGSTSVLAGLTFYKEPPFDVKVGDLFALDGHKGGTIRRVWPDPVLGLIAAEADLDVGR